MRHLFSTLILIVCGIFCAQSAFCDKLAIKGKWSEEGIRSVVPAPPAASIDGKVLTINFVDPLSDLTVTVTDSTGKVIYEECISAFTPESFPIALNAESGNYTLTFTHDYGQLAGTFAIM